MFEGSGGWPLQEGLRCFCHIFYSKHKKYDFILFTYCHWALNWMLRICNITLSAVLSKTEHRILYGWDREGLLSMVRHCLVLSVSLFILQCQFYKWANLTWLGTEEIALPCLCLLQPSQLVTLLILRDPVCCLFYWLVRGGSNETVCPYCNTLKICHSVIHIKVLLELWWHWC